MYLGGRCRHGHNKDGQAIRYIKSKKCVACQKAYEARICKEPVNKPPLRRMDALKAFERKEELKELYDLVKW